MSQRDGMVSSTLTVKCGVAEIGDRWFEELSREWERVSPTGPVTLIVDVPTGYALSAIETEESAPIAVLTTNCCPDYLDDLWETRRCTLISNRLSANTIVGSLVRASRGEYERLAIQALERLTPRERTVLRHCALGLKNGEIARRLACSERTVKNHLARVISKRNLRNRQQVPLYYWGLWSQLRMEGWGGME